MPDSTSTGALGAGPQGFDASYSGDANYQPGSVACEPFTVLEAPLITSADGTAFTILEAGTFTVTTTGYPSGAAIALSDGGASLPSGVSFVDNGDGTATLGGTPALGTTGSYPFTVTADNGVAPVGSQGFALTVDVAGTATTVSSATNPSVVGESRRPHRQRRCERFRFRVAGRCGQLRGGRQHDRRLRQPSRLRGERGLHHLVRRSGERPLTAVYGGDANFAGSSAAAVTQHVTEAATATGTTSSANPAVTGERSPTPRPSRAPPRPRGRRPVTSPSRMAAAVSPAARP